MKILTFIMKKTCNLLYIRTRRSAQATADGGALPASHVCSLPAVSAIVYRAHTSDSPYRMLSARSSSAILHLGSIRHLKPSFKAMAHEQANWKAPLRLTGEPVLKVYNTLTRTKVGSSLLVRSFVQLVCFIFRTCLLRATGGASNGTTVDPLYTTLLTWAMQGVLSVRLSNGKITDFFSIPETTSHRISYAGSCLTTLVTTSTLR
jgi:hypothetical protein